tara:strand:+ start:861 stop:1019 length:159 start_codon:yes stop_codon:yes gene_type:complete
MNDTIRHIMALLKIDAEAAERVYDSLFIDFSRCSTRELNREIRSTHARLDIV